MQAIVAPSSLVVHLGESSWPFELNLTDGAASIALDGFDYEVRPLAWGEKMRLARFAHLGADFIQARFLETCVRRPSASPRSEQAEAVLVALAMWLSMPSEEMAGLPLDHARLAGVTVELCRWLGIGPAALGELAVPEVEILWHSLAQQKSEDELAKRPGGQSTGLADEHSPPPDERFDNKIVIVPDESNPPEYGASGPRRQGVLPPEDDSQQRRDEAAPGSKTRHNSSLTIQAETQARPQRQRPDLKAMTARDGANRSSGVMPEGAKQPASQYADRSESPKAELSAAREITPPGRTASARFRVSLDSPAVNRPKRNFFDREAMSIGRQAGAGRAALTPLAASRRAASTPVPEPREKACSSEMITKDDASSSPGAADMLLAPSQAKPGVGIEDGSSLQAEDMELMLDEFCERLAEAAADLGIMEEV